MIKLQDLVITSDGKSGIVIEIDGNLYVKDEKSGSCRKLSKVKIKECHPYLIDILKIYPGKKCYNQVYGQIRVWCEYPNYIKCYDPIYTGRTEHLFNCDAWGRSYRSGEFVLFPSKREYSWEKWIETRGFTLVKNSKKNNE